MSVTPEFSFPIDITTLPALGRHYSVAASDEDRARVAERLELQKVDELSAVFEVKPSGHGLIKVTGTLKATVVQTCVVSLVPVPADLSDSVEATFMTEERAARDKAKREKAKATGKELDEEDLMDLEEIDPPEVAEGGRIDLGELAVAQLALALDPYPRVPGVAFDAKAWGLDPENPEKAPETNPFAALSKLKPQSNKPD